MKCPCHSDQEYETCCAPYHRGELPPNALLLMRSRYSAYAMGLTSYIIATTHPDHPDHKKPLKSWTQQITTFSKNTQFTGLSILEFTEIGDHATVTFHATLSQSGRDTSFTERSEFLRLNGHWLYLRPLSLSK